MSEIFKKFFFLIEPKFKYKIFFLTFIILILAIFEILSIGAIVPFIYSILSDKNFFLINYFDKIIDLSSINLVKFSLTIIFLIFLIKNVIVILLFYLQSSLASNIRKNLSQKIYKSFLNIDYRNYLKKNSSEFVKNINVECENFRYALFIIISSITEIIIFFFIISFLLIYNPYFSIIIFFLVLLFFFIYNFCFKKILKEKGVSRFKNLEKLFKIVTESLASLKEIKVLGIKNNFIKKFNLANLKYTKDVIFSEFFLNMPKALVELTGVSVIVLVIFINIDSSYSAVDLITSLGVYGLASFRILPCLNRVLLGYNHLKFASETVDRLFLSVKDINIEEKIDNGYFQSKDKILSVDSISIINLSFSFGEKNKFLIENMNFEIKKNSFVGLVGKSGSGKSTLLNIIVGLLKPDKGTVYYNKNLDIFKNLKYFNRKIAYVSQEINIIDDTIKNNIAFGIEEDEIDINKLLQAIENARLSSFIKELNMGLETILGDRGARISGGQKQRIGIARALYFNPDLIIFDEATNALDYLTEKEIIESIFQLKGKKTIIFATHQTSLLKNCDTIIEIVDNKLKIL
jgi:ABC-type bacteriocin/lantibiotic exporter with double-glycine peptidase domain